jgi:hypothetical protein
MTMILRSPATVGGAAGAAQMAKNSAQRNAGVGWIFMKEQYRGKGRKSKVGNAETQSEGADAEKKKIPGTLPGATAWPGSGCGAGEVIPVKPLRGMTGR